jgi:hypothetical protein
MDRLARREHKHCVGLPAVLRANGTPEAADVDLACAAAGLNRPSAARGWASARYGGCSRALA